MNKEEFMDRLQLIEKNSDFPGTREVYDNQENVHYPDDSNIRIWYNDVSLDCEPHWHNALEIIYVTEEWYDIISDGVTHHLLPGDIVIIPSGISHAIKAPETGTRFVYLINVEPFKNLKDYSVLRPLMTQCFTITATTEPKIYESIKLLLEQSRSVYFSKKDFREMKIYSLILQLLTTIGHDRLNKLHTSSKTSPTIRSEHIERFNDVLNFINANYTRNLTLDDVANYCGFSRFYFAKLFKEYSNTTFVNYLNYKRISAAQELLVSSDKPVIEIAYSCGFSSLSTFNRCFKNQNGCSPTAYKELYEGNTCPLSFN